MAHKDGDGDGDDGGAGMCSRRVCSQWPNLIFDVKL